MTAGVTNSPIRGHAPAERTITKFGVRGRVVDVIICVKILSKSVKGFPSCGGGAKMGVFHWLWQSPLQQVSTTVLPVMWPRWSEIADFRSIFACSASAVTASDKSSIITYRKSTMRFSMSPRWISYVVSEPPKGGSKTQTVHNLNNKLRYLRNGTG